MDRWDIINPPHYVSNKEIIKNLLLEKTRESMEKEEKSSERVAIFIDGSNLYHSLRAINIQKIDYQKLVDVLRKGRLLISIFYYNAPLDISIDKKKYWEQQRFFDILKRLPGFNVILCRRKKFKKADGSFGFEVKGDDVYLAIDLVSGAYENLYDTAIIVSGDEDFVPAIQKVKKLGKKVENAYFIRSSSTTLKKTSDASICLNEIIREIV